MKKGLFSFIILFSLLLVVGCSEDIDKSPKELLESKGYEIILENGLVDTYELTKENLIKLPYANIWGLQSINPIEYIGKTINTYSFIVKNHKLDDMKNNNKKETLVWVMTHDDKVIGGYSFPNYDVPHSGGVYSLEGETLEEVTKMDFQEWRENWENRFQE